MKLAKHNNNLLTNTNNETENFGIGDASVVIEILRNRLYKHKIRTLAQEYISNARDANREVDSKRDIEVTAPTHFDPTFKVRDFGQGISPLRMSTVFIKYGASTKRDSNNQTGGFGIGAKSAWSYTDSFTIITHIDGVKRTYIAHTGLNNNGRLDMLSEVATNEPNGTEIQIGVNPDDISKFTKSIQRAVHFWSEGVVLKGMDITKQDLSRGVFIDGNKSIEVLTDNGISEYGFNYWSDKIILSIDGILYQVDNDRFNTSEIVNGAIIHIPVGLIEVSASREEISICDANTNVIIDLALKFNNEIEKYKQSKLNSVKKIRDKVKVISELSELFIIDIQNDGYSFKNDRISHKSFEEISLIKYSTYRGKLNKTHICDKSYSRSRNSYDLVPSDLYFFDNTESIVKRNKRIRKYLETNDKITVLELRDSDKKLYTKFKTDLDFQDLLSLDLPIEIKTASSPRVKRANTEFCIHSLTHHYGIDKITTTLANNTTKWYYLSINDKMYKDNKYNLRKMPVSVCGLSESTIKRVKDNSNFIDLHKYLKTVKPTQDQLSAIKNRVATNRNLNEFDADSIDNKNIKKAVSEYMAYNGKRIDDILFDTFKDHKEIAAFRLLDKKVNELLSQCPLINRISVRNDLHKKEVSIYINAKLKQLKKGV
jgi:hypothetical protein